MQALFCITGYCYVNFIWVNCHYFFFRAIRVFRGCVYCCYISFGALFTYSCGTTVRCNTSSLQLFVIIKTLSS